MPPRSATKRDSYEESDGESIGEEEEELTAPSPKCVCWFCVK